MDSPEMVLRNFARCSESMIWGQFVAPKFHQESEIRIGPRAVEHGKTPSQPEFVDQGTSGLKL